MLTVPNPASRVVPSTADGFGSEVESSKNGVWCDRVGAPQPLARLRSGQFGHEASPNGDRLAVLDNFYTICRFASRLSFGPGHPSRRSGSAPPDSRRAWLVAERHAHCTHMFSGGNTATRASVPRLCVTYLIARRRSSAHRGPRRY